MGPILPKLRLAVLAYARLQKRMSQLLILGHRFLTHQPEAQKPKRQDITYLGNVTKTQNMLYLGNIPYFYAIFRT